MAYRQVTRQELEEYIAKNPGAKYRVNGQEVQAPFQDEDKGVVMNLLTTLSKPLRTIAGGTYSAITGREKDNPFFTQREELDYAENPTLFGAKQAIGLGSYLLPVGAAEGATGLKAVGQAAKSGLLPGAMGGVAFSEQGKELSGALKGGVTGGLFAGTLQGSSELIKAAKKRGGALKRSGQEGFDKLAVDDLKVLDDKSVVLKEIESQIKNIDKIQADKFPISPSTMKRLGYSPQELSKLKNSLLDDMSKRGFSINSADDLANNLGNYRRALLQEKEHILARMGNKQLVGTGEITKSLKRFSDIVGENKTTTRMLNDEISNIFGKGYSIEKLPKRMNTAQVVRLKETIDDIAGGFEKAMAADTSSVASAQLLKKIRDASRGVLTGNKSLDDILEKMSNTYKLEPAIMEAPIISQNLIQKAAMQTKKQLDSLGIKRAQELRRLTDEARALEALNQIGLKIPGTDASIPIPINPKTVGSSVQYRVGSVLEGLPELSFLRNVGQRAVPAVAGLRADTQEVGTQGVGTQPIYPTGTIPTTQGGQQGVGAQGISPLNLMLAQEVLNGNISAAEANAVLSLLGMEQDKTPQASAAQMDAQNAINMVNRLSQSIASTGLTGPIKGLGAKIPYATEFKDLQAQIDLARQVVGKFLEGGVLRKEDEEKYKKILPTMYDTPEVAQRKLQNIMTELQSRLAQYEATGYSGYGQDPYAAIDELGL